MLYEVTFQVNGDEQTDQIEAPDAATAASRARNAHAADDAVFELLLVHLVEDQAPASTSDETLSASK